ncbi:TPA_asm: putative glycoprotein [Periplaneta americana mononega-like virus]|uniref:Glycoprotein n=1 Tax=Periplaneta americana mononega-like virus TaxID=2968923 RepID=A0AAV2YI32_9VIRU|nr:putative glycoprotein [Periplaneta americana mononega-like virus]DAZ90404.1 TPA_asm: putative glycoprotein [Periplaneta americana mononega-like virus]
MLRYISNTWYTVGCNIYFAIVDLHLYFSRWLCGLLYLPYVVDGLIGFDCHHKDVKIRPIALNGVDPCPDYQSAVTKTPVDIQLIQHKTTSRVYYQQCSITYIQTIYHCGMHSHISAVAGGLKEGFKHVSRDICKDMHHIGIFPWDNNVVIRNLEPNTTTRTHITLSGRLSTDSSCKGSTFVDEGRDYDSVVVQLSMKVTLKDGWTPVNLDEKLLQLPSGGTVDYGKGETIDFVYGNTYWNLIETESCDMSRYDVLFDGPGVMLTEALESSTRKIVVVESSSQTFSVELRSATLLCSQPSYTTESPRLFVVVIPPGMPRYFRRSTPLDPLDVSLTAYVNSKFVYVERHIRTQIESLYTHVMTQSCTLARQALLNTLSLAFINEDEFAYAYTGEKGHTAVRRGEVINLIDCVPVPVTVRQTSECYSDLPVVYKNQSAFLSPKSSVLKHTGIEIECSPVLPVWYYLEDGWYNVYGGPMTSTFTPQRLAPMITPKWKYIIPNDLATRGLYTQEEMSRLETHLMYPGERDAALNILGRGYIGQIMVPQGQGVGALLTQKDLSSISTGIFKEMWGFLGSFGAYASGFVGVYIIIRAVKLLLNSIVNGAMLYKMFGLSIKLFACVWTNATSWLLMSKPSTPENSKTELQELIVQPCQNLQSLPDNDPPPSDTLASAPSLYPNPQFLSMQRGPVTAHDLSY